MVRKSILALVTILVSLTIVTPAFAQGGRAGEVGLIYVTSQGLYYETFVTKDPLPMHGKFQKLEVTADGPQTEFGPGDPGYRGGRWWIDVNGNDIQDVGDHFFLCPLLGPGIETP